MIKSSIYTKLAVKIAQFTELDINCNTESDVSCSSFKDISCIPTNEHNMPNAAIQNGRAYSPMP